MKGLFAILFFLGFGGYVIYRSGIVNKDVGASAVLNPFGEVSKSALPPIPQIRGYNNILWTIDEMKLRSYVSLPILGGERGRENPFEDFRPAKETEPGMPAPDGAGNGGEGAISQGSK